MRDGGAAAVADGFVHEYDGPAAERACAPGDRAAMIAVGGASDGHVCEPTGSAVRIRRGGLAHALREPPQVPHSRVSPPHPLEASGAAPRCPVFLRTDRS